MGAFYLEGELVLSKNRGGKVILYPNYNQGLKDVLFGKYTPKLEKDLKVLGLI